MLGTLQTRQSVTCCFRDPHGVIRGRAGGPSEEKARQACVRAVEDYCRDNPSADPTEFKIELESDQRSAA